MINSILQTTMLRKTIMTASSLTLGIFGVMLSFAPNYLWYSQNIKVTVTALVITQILGALYFSFAILNWLAKGSMLGGIYNRPIILANFTHYIMGCLSLLKGPLLNSDGSYQIYLLVLLYSTFSISFGFMLITNPNLNEPQSPISQK